MVQTNEFERNLTDQGHLKRPGRIDMIVFQNVADAGDGSPGIQRCFRNYLHEGGMEKDLDLVGYAIKGTSVNISNAEMQQLSNIGTASINGTQWGRVASMQSVATGASPTFIGLTLSADLVTTSTVDGVDVSVLKTDFDNHKANNGSDHIFIDQSVVLVASPTFVGLTLSADLVTTSTIDGVDVSVHDHSGGDKGVAIPFTSLSSIVDTSGVGSPNMISHAQHVHNNDGSSKVDHINLNSIGSHSHTQISTHINTIGTPHVSSGEKTTWNNKVDDAGAVSALAGADVYVKTVGDAMDGALAMGNNKITGLGNPTSNQDGAPKIYVDDRIDGQASNNSIHTNISEKSNSNTAYQKVKETKTFLSMHIRVYWEAKVLGAPGSEMWSRLYINGVAISSEKNTASTGYVSFTHDTIVKAGDLIQIYVRSYKDDPPYHVAAYVQNLTIKYDIDYVSNS